ncbi:MAG: hypothetical protein HUJ76_02020 [Parasporobacterium sp.]|nr:hypothetical protein [Parasporobacterium sp.]
MKHFKSIKKTAAAAAGLGLIACLAVPAMAYSGNQLEAPKANGVTIDGDLSEWDTSKALVINSEGQIIDQIEHWDGEEDCSAKMYVMWDEDNLYLALDITDDTPFIYREGFPLDELDAFIFFLSTNPDADPDREAYEATDWRVVTSVEDYYGDWFTYVDREMIEDNKGFETVGEYGDEQVFEDFEAAFSKTDTGAVYEVRLGWSNLANDDIAQLVPAAGMNLGFDFSVLDVDLPCPGIHSLRMQSSANIEGRDRTPALYDVDNNPSLWGTLILGE